MNEASAVSITQILRRQIAPTIEMLEDVIGRCPEEVWTLASEPPSQNVPVWEQVYHAAFWLNAWARDWSTPLQKPAFHSELALGLESGASPVITREQMREYLAKAKRECMAFLDDLTDETLVVGQQAFGKTWTPADRILGQIRHVQYHAGMANARVEEATGLWPDWKGYNE